MTGRAPLDRDALVTTTCTERHDILVQLRAAWISEAPLAIDTRFLLMEAADEIENLRWKIEQLQRPWWRKWLAP